MLLGLKKQEIITLSKCTHHLNAHQLIEPILWVDALVSGNYTKHSNAFTYVDLSNDLYTTKMLAKIYPEARFYHKLCMESDKNLHPLINDRINENSVDYLYLGRALSISSAAQQGSIVQFVQQKLSQGGYVIIPYEATVGWSE